MSSQPASVKKLAIANAALWILMFLLIRIVPSFCSKPEKADLPISIGFIVLTIASTNIVRAAATRQPSEAPKAGV
jgi:hypothetical protein